MIKSKIFRRGIFLIFFIHASITIAQSNPIVFVTQVPQPEDFATIGSTFANHLPFAFTAPRGGDLYIRYADGTLKNLTKSAGYGVANHQGAEAIAVRDPAVHWEAKKILFSMVVGNPRERYEEGNYRWQLYELRNFSKGETPIITKISKQPTDFNNVMPIYTTNEKIIFVSDRPRNGAPHLYPQLDEYESTESNSGLWKLTPSTGELLLLDHAPSGVFHPIIDSFGRVVFSRWDHMQRDQQTEDESLGAFNYEGEEAASSPLNHHKEIYPEPRFEYEQSDPNLNLHRFNHFFPWEINEDGSSLETLNHIGRHELHDYFEQSFLNDNNLEPFALDGRNSQNQNEILNLFHIREDPTQPGLFFGIDAPEFATHSAGRIVTLTGSPNTSTNDMTIEYITHPDTNITTNLPSANHSGFYRNPLPTSDGELLAVHTSETREDRNIGTLKNPNSLYDFRIVKMKKSASYWIPNIPLTSGISKLVTWWSPDELITYNGNLWELQPVEVTPRTRPTPRKSSIQAPEKSIFAEKNVSLEEFRSYLVENNLAVIVSRNVTSRDKADKQQPFNLKVTNSNTQTAVNNGELYEVDSLQIFQGDQIRAYKNLTEGRRIIPQTLHALNAQNPANPEGPAGSVRIAADGSLAAFVPAGRALTWQLTDAAGKGVVRERYWLTFKAGEIRLCTSCHGLNEKNQINNTEPQNPPQALAELLDFWLELPKSEKPSFSITAEGKNKKGKFKANKFFRGKLAKLNIEGANRSSIGKELAVHLSIKRKGCGKPIVVRTTDDNGNIYLQGISPKIRNSLSLNFSAKMNGEVVASQRVKLRGRSRKLYRPITRKIRKRVCRKLDFS